MERPEIMSRLEAILSESHGVSAAAYFGSIARGTPDEFSDIDLLVRDDSAARWQVAARLQDELGAVLFRPFTATRAPSGRYWFEAAHPFLRLDVSFHEPADYDRVISVGDEFVRPPVRHVSLGDDRPRGRVAPHAWSEGSKDSEVFAGALREYQEAAKALARGGEPKRSLAMASARVDAFAGRAISADAWALYERSRRVVREAGLEGAAFTKPPDRTM